MMLWSRRPLARFADLDDGVPAVFASDTRWTVVRASDLEEGESRAEDAGRFPSQSPGGWG